MNFEILNYKMLTFRIEIEYIYGDYYYTVMCDFEWSDECTSNYIDFTITPLYGTFFHSDTDEVGDIEITEEYTAFLQDKLKEYRNNTLWLSEEIQEKMQDLDMNEQDWSYYGI
jgi:hypothetical protein